ncbi:hypothetical protein J6590_003466 [Homalodisca vitripennis]|nr:hypothetical protein J6590_003466 [Homalodisca vitripennis]
MKFRSLADSDIQSKNREPREPHDNFMVKSSWAVASHYHDGRPTMALPNPPRHIPAPRISLSLVSFVAHNSMRNSSILLPPEKAARFLPGKTMAASSS